MRSIFLALSLLFYLFIREIQIMHLETLLSNITKHASLEDPYAASHLPIYNTATFDLRYQQGSAEFDYSRSGNPTRAALEAIFAKAENGYGCRCTNTGLSAVALVVETTLFAGDHVLVEEDCYGGTYRLLNSMKEHYGIHIHFVDMTDESEIEEVLQNFEISLVICESPTNPGLKVVDLSRIADLCKRYQSLMAVDNSMATFASQRPLDLGADFSFFSTTKFISGHGSVTAGAVVSKTKELHDKIAFMCNAQGRAQSPMDVYLTSLGLPTLLYRMKQQEASAHIIYNYLKEKSVIAKVRFPGAEDSPYYALSRKQMGIIPSIITFDIESQEAMDRLFERSKLFGKKVSFGTSDSRLEIPTSMSHNSVHDEHFIDSEVGAMTVRMSVGLEHVDDLIADLDQALKHV